MALRVNAGEDARCTRSMAFWFWAGWGIFLLILFSVGTRGFHASSCPIQSMLYILFDPWGRKYRSHTPYHAEREGRVSGKISVCLWEVWAGPRPEEGGECDSRPLIPSVWWAPVHRRQSVRSAVEPFLSRDSGGFLSCHILFGPSPATLKSKTNPIQLTKEPDACLPLRPEGSVTYFPLLATGAGDPVAFLGPLSRHHSPGRNERTAARMGLVRVHVPAREGRARRD